MAELGELMSEFPFTIEVPLGPKLPIIRSLGVRGSNRVRHRFRQGLAGAWDHWADYGRALVAAGLTPRELQNVRDRIAAEDAEARRLEMEADERPSVDEVVKVLKWIPKDAEIREAVQFMLRGGA